jgi:hypothetical protein
MIYELKKFRTLGLSDMYEGHNQDFRILKKNWRTIHGTNRPGNEPTQSQLLSVPPWKFFIIMRYIFF